jgi:hypothetical protein
MVVTGPNASDWEEQDIGAGLDAWQAVVGGLIEALNVDSEQATVIINEEGALDNLPIFALWTNRDGRIIEALHGPLLILGPIDDEGGTRPLTDAALAYARTVVRPVKQQEMTAFLTDGTPCEACGGRGYQRSQ